MRALREACAAVAARAQHVTIVQDAIPGYAAALASAVARRRADGSAGDPDPGPVSGAEREALATLWLTLDAINFGSGWFPTLRKRSGLSGYQTIAAAWTEHAAGAGAWTPAELAGLAATDVATILGQDPGHELMALYARSLNDLGRRVAVEHGGSFAAVVDAAGGSAVRLATGLGEWACFADCSRYGGLSVPFLKRAQIAAADLHRAGAVSFDDLNDLTMFADNLVPHVLRLDGVLRFAPELVARIEREELIEHGSADEIEIRACAVHVVELLTAAAVPDEIAAAEIDQLLWERGQEPVYKASPRHRSRCTAY
jgi:Potential Queuosine, Q, salvage protein family